jgi:hypothetical protein
MTTVLFSQHIRRQGQRCHCSFISIESTPHKGPFLAADGEKQQRCHSFQEYNGKANEFPQNYHENS